MERSNVFYAVQRGWNRGVYNSWRDCRMQICGYSNPKFKKFFNKKDAMIFAYPELYPMHHIEKEEDEGGYNDFKNDNKKAQEMEQNLLSFISFVKDRKSEDTKMEQAIKIPTTQPRDCVIHTWISVSKSINGIIGIYFGEDDKRNFIGFYLEKGFITMTRLRLAACIKAMNLASESSPCTIMIHTENKYLGEKLSTWIKEWYSRGKDKNWAKSSEVDHVLLEQLCETCNRLGIKLVASHCKNKDENMIKISKMVSDFVFKSMH